MKNQDKIKEHISKMGNLDQGTIDNLTEAFGHEFNMKQ
jgi:hypothetical protein